jgi:hypothetical protein
MIPEPQSHHAERQSDNDDANSCECLASLSRAARSILAHFRREVDKSDYEALETNTDDNSSTGELGYETASTSGGSYHTAPETPEPGNSSDQDSDDDCRFIALAARFARSKASPGHLAVAQKNQADEERPLLGSARAQETK